MLNIVSEKVGMGPRFDCGSQGWALTEKVHEPPGLVNRKIYEPSPISTSPTLRAKLASDI